MTRDPDLIVISHLRWTWVWQRPQHLISRLAKMRSDHGARTFFVEEPLVGDVVQPMLRMERQLPNLYRIWLEVPAGESASPNFDDPRAAELGALLAGLLDDIGGDLHPDVWLYTPMGLDVARHVQGGRIIYDVMDDLASFRNPPRGLLSRQLQLFGLADVVFTGGRSLHRSVLKRRRENVHLFPSGVETAHYATASEHRNHNQRPVAGYVGVIDERIDLNLVAELAAALPDWTIRMAGPTAKLHPNELPTAPNLEYTGMVRYEDLPRMMGSFNAALMPFALNEATKSISPTKTLEYLAAGLPVISTRVPDVVADYSEVVQLADDASGFADACRQALHHDTVAWQQRVTPILVAQEWDAIAAAMADIIDRIPGPVPAIREVEETA